MEQTNNRNVVPVGPGGTLGMIGRMIVMFATGGFAYPNVFIEGMDCTAIQKKTEGNLYKRPGEKRIDDNSKEGVQSWGTQEAPASAGK